MLLGQEVLLSALIRRPKRLTRANAKHSTVVGSAAGPVTSCELQVPFVARGADAAQPRNRHQSETIGADEVWPGCPTSHASEHRPLLECAMDVRLLVSHN